MDDDTKSTTPSKGLGLDDDIDAALSSPSTTHEPEYRSRRPPSIEIHPPTPREMYQMPPRPMTMSTKRLSYTDIDQARRIKYGSGKHAGVELVPQPSDNPEDPLNWMQWRKTFTFFSLLFAMALANGTKTALIPVNADIAGHYHISYTAVASLTAVPLVIASFSGLACSILARMWGKRPVYLGAVVFLLIGCIWNSCAEKYGDCMGARVFQGVAWGAFDTLLLGSIQDLFYEHEHPIQMTIYNCLNLASTWGPPLLGGLASRNADSFIVQFRIIIAFLCVSAVLLLVGAPETAYDRYGGGSSNRTPPYTPSQPLEARGIFSVESLKEYASKLRLVDYHGEVSIRAAAQPVRACGAPTVGLLTLGTFLPYCGFWGLLITISLLFSVPPFALSSAAVGAMLGGPFIMSVLVALGVSFCFAKMKAPTIQNSPLMLLIATCCGTFLASTGLLAYGLTIYDTITKAGSPREARENLNFPLLSFLLSILTSGCTVLIMTTRPLIMRNAYATCINVVSRSRAEFDMHTGVQFWRGLMAGIFVAAAPGAIDVATRVWSTTTGVRDFVVGMGVSHIAVVFGCTLVWKMYEQGIRQWDASVMGLEDLNHIKRSGSFFDWD